MFYLGWILLTLSGILLSIVAFIWAIRTGQFSDQGRARYLPLRDGVPTPERDHPSRLSIEVYVLLSVFGIGLLSMACTVALILFRLRG
jgi:cbb3-type cytochrome oxidase maturation protein